MSVLKDAASAALYGNRAANGVILITTKRAKYGIKPTINLQINNGVYTRGIAEYERLSADQWMEASLVSNEELCYVGKNAFRCYCCSSICYNPPD